MEQKLLLIDGNSILNRAFYGLPDMTNSQGLHTNAVLGFLNIMFKFLEEENPTHLAVAFDLKAPTFRHKMFADYKGTRKGMPDELREQVPVIREVLQAMNIPLMMKEGYEADDLLGTMSVLGEEAGFEVKIISETEIFYSLQRRKCRSVFQRQTERERLLKIIMKMMYWKISGNTERIYRCESFDG